jgi:hypothetical protein
MMYYPQFIKQRVNWQAPGELDSSRSPVVPSKTRDDITMDAERQAIIQEQERLAREGSRLLDVVHQSIYTHLNNVASYNEILLSLSLYQQFKFSEQDKLVRHS